MTDIRAILFDMDGVLVRSEEVWFRLVEEAGRKFRGTPVTREAFAPTFGQGTKADVESFKLGITPDELDAYYKENFTRYADATWVDPTAADVLRELRRRRVQVAVVTNTMTTLAREILERAGLWSHVDVLACANEVEHAKPAPDLLLLALERLGRQASDVWMVGDSRFDREAAQAAGVHFIGYRMEGDVRVEALDALVGLLG